MTAPSARPDTFAALREKIAAVEAETVRLVDDGEIDWRDSNLPDDIRARLLVLGSSQADCVFWVRRKAREDDLGSRMFWAEEMEAGTGAWGVDARHALERYLSDDVLDHRWPG